MTTTDQRPAARRPQASGLLVHDASTIERMVEQVARYAVEIVRDIRPENALSRLITPEVEEVLSRRAALTRRLRATAGHRPNRRILITGVRTCVVNEKAIEASCVVREPDRARFLAMRWELRHSGWRVTVLEMG
ncbi:MAG TPA: hypothetical protein H9786_04935 [Candidatus Brachybacterium merdavium]|uniref:Uncharacterized protein n=1 Tax=Candidatus Brachybacterium merdavium TaxID=2838513 RepID=A0A9D2LC24_9MICO|nr:hypothetical protein [Candidatus Brachybacterium merdavium]